MRKIAVLDDDKAYLDSVCALISEYEAERGGHFAVECFCSSSDFLDKIENGAEFDIYFFDVYMPGVTGIGVAEELRNRSIENPIVFFSSSPDFALRAFGVNATHYLLKPYSRKEFFDAIDKALRALGVEQPKTALLKTSSGYRKVSVNKIVYSESDNHNQRICMHDGESLYIRASSADLCEKLAPFGHFHPCGKAYIINLEHIDKLLSDRAVMGNGDNLAIPRRAMANLKCAYLNYLSRR